MKHLLLSLTLLANFCNIKAAASYERVAAKDTDKKTYFDTSHLIKVHSGKNALESQCAGRLTGYRHTPRLVGCIVADPNLTTHFPCDAAEQLLGLVRPGMLELYPDELNSSIETWNKQNINTEALKTGKTACRFAGIFMITRYDGFSDVQRFSVYFPGGKTFECGLDKPLFLSIRKNADDRVECSSLDDQPHIKLLAERGETAVIAQLWDEALTAVDGGITLVVDLITVKSFLEQPNELPRGCCSVL